jgi:pyochelin biosynthetic protein PchC
MPGDPQWIFPLRKNSDRPISRLLVFPFAAAGPTALRSLVVDLPDSVEVMGVALPGRERRFGERPSSSLTAVTDSLSAALHALVPLPTYLLGHSMGAGLALTLALTDPECCAGLVVSGRKPRGVALDTIRGLSDAEIVAFLARVGSTKAELLAEPFWRDRLIQLFRSDTELDVQAAPLIESGRLTQPMLAIGGLEDSHVAPDSLSAWHDYTSGRCAVLTLPGDHFYLLDPANHPAMSGALSELMWPAVQAVATAS